MHTIYTTGKDTGRNNQGGNEQSDRCENRWKDKQTSTLRENAFKIKEKVMRQNICLT